MPDLGKAAESASSSTKDNGPAVDPMQWWGSLTQQFQNIAAAAVKDVAAQALKDKPKAARKTKASTAKTRSTRAKKPAKPASQAVPKSAS